MIEDTTQVLVFGLYGVPLPFPFADQGMMTIDLAHVFLLEKCYVGIRCCDEMGS